MFKSKKGHWVKKLTKKKLNKWQNNETLKKLLKQRNVQKKSAKLQWKTNDNSNNKREENELHCHFARFQIANKLRGNNLLSKYRNDNTFHILKNRSGK